MTRAAPRPNLLLASASPRRRSLLRAAGYRFRVVPSRVRETHPRHLSPSALVRRLARLKAVAVARAHPEAVVIGADTIVVIHGRVVGKPRDAAHARRILETLSGAWQKVYTGVAVAWDGGGRVRSGVAVSAVKLRRLTDAQIARACRRHLDKAGAYAVQEVRDPFVERIRGDYDNVVGFPMRVVERLLSLTL